MKRAEVRARGCSSESKMHREHGDIEVLGTIEVLGMLHREHMLQIRGDGLHKIFENRLGLSMRVFGQGVGRR